MEYRFVKVPCSGDSEVGDSVVLVVEDFEHVGSDGSPVFGDPRYIPCNPAVKTALQRPAPPSPSKKENSQSVFDYTFTQSLDPTDLLFLETTCTQAHQRQSQTFPQVISDLDWRIPEDQVKILERIELIKLAAYDYSDVELSEDDEKIKRTREAESQPLSLPFSQQLPQTQYEQPAWTQVPMTQVPLTQTQTNITQPSQFTEPKTQYSYSGLIFPETQVASSASVILDNNSPQTPLRMSKDRSSPSKKGFSPVVKDVIKTTIDSMNQVPSSPINSPVKSPLKSKGQSPIKQVSASPSSNVVFEYPDYSAW